MLQSTCTIDFISILYYISSGKCSKLLEIIRLVRRTPTAGVGAKQIEKLKCKVSCLKSIKVKMAKGRRQEAEDDGMSNIE